jgi:penicillin amidase
MRRVPAPDGPRRRALELLTAWDGSMHGDSAAAAVFQAYYQATLDAVFADELGELYADGYADERNAQAMALHRVLLGDGAYWCDDITTRDVDEDCPAILARALDTGLAAMTALQGADDPASWRWDRVHHAVFAHTPFSRVEALRTTFERRVPNGGDGFTVNVAPIRVTELYNQYNVPSYRQVVDLGQPEASLYMHTTGQSGNVLSEHFADLLTRWQQVAYLPMRAAAGDGAVLTLRP